MLLFLFVLSGKSGKGPSLFWRPRNPLKTSSTRNASGIEVGQVPTSWKIYSPTIGSASLSSSGAAADGSGSHIAAISPSTLSLPCDGGSGIACSSPVCWGGSWTGTRKLCNAAAPIVYRALGVHVCSQPRSGGCDVLDDWSSYFTKNITVFVQKILYLLTTAVLEKQLT